MAATGVSANAISIFGMLAAIGAGVALGLTRCDCAPDRALWLVAAALVMARLLANMFDGMVALESGTESSVGELFNEVPDRISDAAVLIGAGYAAGGSLELGCAAAVVALLVAYVRAASRVAGAPSDFGGPMAKQHRMFAVVLAAVYVGVTPSAWWPTWGPDGDWGIPAIALLAVVVGGALTFGLRLRRAGRALR